MINEFADYCMRKTLEAKKNPNFISLTVLEQLFDPNQHPEALSYQTVYSVLKNEFLTHWDKEKEDDMISLKNFLIFFTDISNSTNCDKKFEQIIRSFGF